MNDSFECPIVHPFKWKAAKRKLTQNKTDIFDLEEATLAHTTGFAFDDEMTYIDGGAGYLSPRVINLFSSNLAHVQA